MYNYVFVYWFGKKIVHMRICASPVHPTGDNGEGSGGGGGGGGGLKIRGAGHQ